MAWTELGSQPDAEKLRQQLLVGSNLNWSLCSKLAAALIIIGLLLGLSAAILAIVAIV